MAATTAEQNRLRRQLKVDETQLPDADIDDMFDEAAIKYPSNTRTVWFAAARLQAASEMWAQYTREASFDQNESSEDLSDVAKALKDLSSSVQIKTFPKDMMTKAKEVLDDILVEESGKNSDFASALKSYKEFSSLNKPWDDISTKHFLDTRG